jgi:PTS system nitrogen regulatory IIA component
MSEDAMQLTAREVSKLLSVSEGMVARWIKQRGLPAQYIGGQYRFNRAELLEWATANKIKVAAELFDTQQAEAEPAPSLAEALEAGGIFHQMPDTDKNRALKALVQVLPLPDGIDRDLLLHLFLAREASASTGIGDGIALPHVRNPIILQVTRPMITLGFLQSPVEFGALDGKPVYVLFSLISPTTRCHLQLMARLSYALHDAGFRDAVLRRGAREEILQEARRVEAELASSTTPPGKAAP